VIYKFTAEHVSRSTAVSLVHEFEAKDIEVDHAALDPTFSNQMLMIVTCDEEVAKQIRARIWEINNGLCCDMDIITPDQLEAYL
jgi:hypothetical protein